jgi:signal transduction histidine kinase
MSVQHTPTQTRKRSSTLDRRLHGRWLALIRGIWLALVIFTLGTFFASLPVYRAQLQTVCATTDCTTYGFQLTPKQAGMLKGIGLSIGDYAAYFVAFTLATMVICLVVSTVIVWRRSDDRTALLVALMLVTLGPIILTGGAIAIPSSWQLPNACLYFLALTLVVLVFSLFPSGQFVPGFTRWTAVVCLTGQIPYTFFPNTPFAGPLGFLVLAAEAATLLVAQLYRYRHVSSPLQRQQTKWVVFGLTLPITVFVGGSALFLIFPTLSDLGSPYGSLYQLAFAVASTFTLLFIPLSFGFAMLRSRLFDIDIIINRTLVYAILTAIVVSIYILVVGILSTLLHTSGNALISLLATGLVAVLFQPLRARLQRTINRMMYGERDDPYAVLSRLGSRLEATLVPEKVLPTIVETVAQTLKLPYVAIALLPEEPPFTGTAATTTGAIALAEAQEAHIAASSGTPTPDPVRVPLVYQAETVGYLLLAARAGDTFGKPDTRLLTDLARQAGVAVYAVRLTTHLQRLSTGLQESRERLVTTREEERRRLRRDLHDGLGPQLSSQTLTLSAARKLLRQDPDAADRLLADATTHAQQAITDIRRLVYGLRPPALDDLGLLAALQEQLTQYCASGVSLILNAPEHLPPLPAAVEVACYRIVQEALTNVIRHAHAHTCTIHFTVDTHLMLDIRDDGQGLPPAYRCGIGFTSMRERAEELGGTCTITAIPDGGTRVLARLPLA